MTAFAVALQVSVGLMGLLVLVAVIRDNKDDVELLRGALEALLHACSPAGRPLPSTSAAAAAPAPPDVVPAGTINAGLYCRTPDHVVLLLSLLEKDAGGASPPGDLYARYFTLQLLNTLLQACPFQVQVRQQRGAALLHTGAAGEQGTPGFKLGLGDN